MNLPPRLLEVFRLIHARLEAEGLDWALTGSLAFAMQGLETLPRDIDIQTDRAGAYRFEALFREHVTHPVGTDRAGERVRSHFGDFDFGGVAVQVMGELQKRDPLTGEWEPPTDLQRHRRFLEFEGMRVPVLDLAYEAESYRRMGRPERAAQLEALAARRRRSAL